MDRSSKTSRRHFIQLATATMAAGMAVAQEAEKMSPDNTVRLATIGIGGRGMDDTDTALKVPGVRLVAVADVYDGRLLRAKELYGDRIFTTRDYREVLARSDVDAVIVATPDHWHAQISMDALDAGKDVYCEKPMVQNLKDGHRLIEAWQKTNRILQVGSQRVSSVVYLKAKELLAKGAIGELNLVEAWWNRNSPLGAWQYSVPPDASPQNIDWDRFLGKAPKVPFEPVRLFRWRNYRDYGTGVAGDLFVHLFSGLHLVTGLLGPTRVMTTGGLRFWKDGRDVPDLMLGFYDYPKTDRLPEFSLTLKVNFEDGAGENSGFRFAGSEGVMTVSSTVTLTRRPPLKAPGYTINTFPKTVQDAFLKEYRIKYPEDDSELSEASEEVYAPPRGYSDSLDHFRNFFAAVRSRKPVVEDPMFGLRAAGPALLSNRSYFERRPFGWDPGAMKVMT